MAIRPESFKSEGSAGLKLTVELVEHLGGETYAYARFGNGDLIIAATDNDRSLDAGSIFEARFNPEAVLVFGEDGQRIR